jgi:hypothetical protein
VISEAQKRENDRIILRSTKLTNTLWQIIKKESGNCHKINQNISLEMGSLLVTNPQIIPYQFNVFFVDNLDRMINLNKDCIYGYVLASNTIHNPNSTFLAPVTQEEVQKSDQQTKRKILCGL